MLYFVCFENKPPHAARCVHCGAICIENRSQLSWVNFCWLRFCCQSILGWQIPKFINLKIYQKFNNFVSNEKLSLVIFSSAPFQNITAHKHKTFALFSVTGWWSPGWDINYGRGVVIFVQRTTVGGRGGDSWIKIPEITISWSRDSNNKSTLSPVSLLIISLLASNPDIFWCCLWDIWPKKKVNTFLFLFISNLTRHILWLHQTIPNKV